MYPVLQQTKARDPKYPKFAPQGAQGPSSDFRALFLPAATTRPSFVRFTGFVKATRR